MNRKRSLRAGIKARIEHLASTFWGLQTSFVVVGRIKKIFCSLAAILIVLVEVVILLCFPLVLSARFFGTRCGTRVSHARAQLCAFTAALGAYYQVVGDFPDTLDGLSSDPGVSGWRGPYLTKGVPLDPWGHPYVYRRNRGGTPEVVTLGADAAPGGTGVNADISSLRLAKEDVVDDGSWIIATILALWLLSLPFVPRLLRRLLPPAHQNFQSLA